MSQYVFILAGGSGKRLWPLGRQKLPKQFIPFEEQKTLLHLTIERAAEIVPREKIWILSVAEYHEILKSYAHDVGRIVTEPRARNTGPALFYALQQLHAIEPSASLIVMPSDHAISDTTGYIRTVTDASVYAKKSQRIVLVGVTPTYAATGYGYIECADSADVTRVVHFHEKPTHEIAQQYLNSGSFLWNTGIFCTPLKTLLHEFVMHTAACYEDLPSESIDYMIFEKSSDLFVQRAAFDWSDVGTLDLFVAAKKDTNKQVVTFNARNVLVHGTNKLVVISDVDDISVIETNDVLLITRRHESEKIKNVVEYLKTHGYEEFI